MADYSTIGLAFPIAIALCWFAGGWIGGLFGSAAAGNWIGGSFGLVAGFYNVYRTALLLQEQDTIGVAEGSWEDPGEVGRDEGEAEEADLRGS